MFSRGRGFGLSVKHTALQSYKRFPHSPIFAFCYLLTHVLYSDILLLKHMNPIFPVCCGSSMKKKYYTMLWTFIVLFGMAVMFRTRWREKSSLKRFARFGSRINLMSSSLLTQSCLSHHHLYIRNKTENWNWFIRETVIGKWFLGAKNNWCVLLTWKYLQYNKTNQPENNWK